LQIKQLGAQLDGESESNPIGDFPNKNEPSCVYTSNFIEDSANRDKPSCSYSSTSKIEDE